MTSTEAPHLASRLVPKFNDANAGPDGPSFALNGIPAVIEWQPVADFLTSLGVDLRNIVADLGGVQIGYDSIRFTLYAANHKGHRYLDRCTGEAAKHEVTIPIVHPEHEQ